GNSQSECLADFVPPNQPDFQPITPTAANSTAAATATSGFHFLGGFFVGNSVVADTDSTGACPLTPSTPASPLHSISLRQSSSAPPSSAASAYLASRSLLLNFATIPCRLDGR